MSRNHTYSFLGVSTICGGYRLPYFFRWQNLAALGRAEETVKLLLIKVHRLPSSPLQAVARTFYTSRSCCVGPEETVSCWFSSNCRCVTSRCLRRDAPHNVPTAHVPTSSVLTAACLGDVCTVQYVLYLETLHHWPTWRKFVALFVSTVVYFISPKFCSY